MEQEYLDLLEYVLEHGDKRQDRTGTGTLSVFGPQLRCNLAHGFPLLTTKKVNLWQVLGELLWFIEGSSDERRLAEITHGTRDADKKTIWTANAHAPYWKPKAAFEGDLGRVYGVQWRKWTHTKIVGAGIGGGDSLRHDDGKTTYFNVKAQVKEHDQLANIIKTLRTNPTDRRMVLTAFNVGELDQMALPPCHMFAQFYVSQGKLSCQVYIRSNDLALGLPYNIVSYAALVEMMAVVTGLKAGELIITIGDAHIYLNHIEQVKEQLSRKIIGNPQLIVNPKVKEIDDFTMADFQLLGYSPHPPIKAEMAV